MGNTQKKVKELLNNNISINVDGDKILEEFRGSSIEAGVSSLVYYLRKYIASNDKKEIAESANKISVAYKVIMSKIMEEIPNHTPANYDLSLNPIRDPKTQMATYVNGQSLNESKFLYFILAAAQMVAESDEYQNVKSGGSPVNLGIIIYILILLVVYLFCRTLNIDHILSGVISVVALIGVGFLSSD